MKTKPDPRQDELALSSIRAHTLFPDRSSLYVGEVARALGIIRPGKHSMTRADWAVWLDYADKWMGK